jgi:GAF domain-containing protein
MTLLGTGRGMEPIPETAALIEEFGKFYDVDLLDELQRKAEAVRGLVPDLVGLTVASLEDGAAFTLVASDADVATLDAVQYVAGGPCVEAPRAEQVLEYDSGQPDDEERWRTFAKATAAKAVATTLTLPILHEGRVVGSVNLYAASDGAFDGLHREIAAILAAWAPGAIVNADLSFRTRETAEHASQAVRTTMRVEMAMGVLMEAQSVDADTARALLEEAAQRAGVPVQELAGVLLEAFDSAEGS